MPQYLTLPSPEHSGVTRLIINDAPLGGVELQLYDARGVQSVPLDADQLLAFLCALPRPAGLQETQQGCPLVGCAIRGPHLHEIAGPSQARSSTGDV